MKLMIGVVLLGAVLAGCVILAPPRSESAAGTGVGVFRITTLAKSLGDLDGMKPLDQVRGASYAAFEKATADAVARIEISIGRFLPELSNPTDEIVAIDPAFWRPKPAAPAKKGEAGTKP